MSTENRALAPYEERLLAELRQTVAAAPAPIPLRTARPRLRLAVGLGAAAVVAVGAAVGGPALLGAGDSPAFAADREPDGSIRVHIREYRDAKGLEARLRELGVPAIVDYVPNGKQCREPRATWVPADRVPPGLLTTMPAEDSERGAYWKLHPELIGAGQTFVYTTTIVGDPDDDEWNAIGRVGLATGPVAACDLVPGPEYPRNGG